MELPSITILTASLNSIGGLRRTIESVAHQQYSRIEHIVVDGGSSDGTPTFLAENHIGPWVSEPDRGIAHALNKGWLLCTGDYVLVLGAGDVLKSTALDTALTHLDRDIVAFDVELSNAQRTLVSSCSFMRRTMLKPFSHQGVFCRREMVTRFGPFDERYRVCMDYDFQLRSISRGATWKCVPLVVSEMSVDGISSRKDRDTLNARFTEERRAQEAHWRKFSSRIFLACYWPMYRAYRFTMDAQYRPR